MTKPYLTIMDHHHLAMEYCDNADFLKRIGEEEASFRLLRKAFEHERAAAELFKLKYIEPTRSVLYRSAGSIALQVGEKSNAKELLLEGLSHNPPPEIAAEINELLKECE